MFGGFSNDPFFRYSVFILVNLSLLVDSSFGFYLNTQTTAQ
jgi:hypothetical protein